MSTLTDGIKEHWEKGAAIVAVAFETAVAFERHLAELSLETRLVVAGVAGLTATLSLAEMLRWNPKRSGTGFHAQARQQRVSAPWMITCALMIVALSVVSVFLLDKTATFHTIRLLQRTDSRDPFVGTIEIQPAHTPANVTVTLSTSQAEGVRIEKKAPASWNDQDKVDWGMQNDTPFGVRLSLKAFKSPQVFGCWYRLSDRADKLEVDAISEPTELRVLREIELCGYRRTIRIFGGVLCIVALFYWSYRSRWFRSAA